MYSGCCQHHSHVVSGLGLAASGTCSKYVDAYFSSLMMWYVVNHVSVVVISECHDRIQVAVILSVHVGM